MKNLDHVMMQAEDNMNTSFVDRYQKETQKTVIYAPDKAEQYLFPGLAAEAGEVCDKYAKAVRDNNWREFHPALAKELGDVMWFVSQLCNHYGLSLAEVMNANLLKLRDRAARDVLSGSGDNR